MADWRLDQKTEETPQGTDLSLLVRGTSVFKTTFQKNKEFIIGTTNMGTTATNVTGAVKELNDKIGSEEKEGSIIASLNEKVNKTSIVNNCSVTEEGFILDARQGKFLNDKIDSIILKRTTITFSSGVGNLTYDGVKTTSICIMQLNFDRDVGINNLFLTENNIKVTLNDKTVNGPMWVSILIKL